ncbi:MAG TPA: poly(3-hydroxyalkanoate) depolymerase [Candidatus Dormibacteraeota bacterium]|nr:poly(3-hydroxyalkanoate) depolymerase [Candidatus Dormibacteraeota bacterium]
MRVDGLELRVALEGEGPPLLLINGIGANIEMWAPFVSALSGHQLILFDAPGTGHSSRTRQPVRMRRLSRVVVGILDQLGYDRVDVLGYSFGGALAQQLAHQHPERVRRLILAGTMCGVGVPANPLVLALMATPLRYYSRSHLARISPVIYGGQSRRDPEVLRRHLAARLTRPPSMLGYQWQLYALAGWSSLLWLHRLEQPTLVLHGEKDPIVPLVNSRLMASRIPGARLEVVPAAGHLFLIDQPEQPAEIIMDFLEQAA